MPSLRDRTTAAISKWNSGDLEGYLSLYDPRIRFHGFGEPMNHVAMVTFYRDVWEALTGEDAPSPQLVIDQFLEESDALAMRFILSGQHRGAFQGTPPTGRSFLVSGITIMRFQGGRCIERWSNVDGLRFFSQLGVIANPILTCSLQTS